MAGIQIDLRKLLPKRGADAAGDLDGRRVELRERMPWLAVGRLIERVESQGRMINRIQRRARVGTPVAVLVGPGDTVTVDWERTLTTLFSQ